MSNLFITVCLHKQQSLLMISMYFLLLYLCCYRSELVHGEKKIKKKRAIGNSYLEHKIKQTEMNGYLVSSI
jgi:hypothetical protein